MPHTPPPVSTLEMHATSGEREPAARLRAVGLETGRAGGIGHVKLLVTADRLHASVGLAHEEARLAAGNHQSENSLVFFEIGQIVVGEEHLAARPAYKDTDRTPALASARAASTRTSSSCRTPNSKPLDWFTTRLKTRHPSQRERTRRRRSFEPDVVQQFRRKFDPQRTLGRTPPPVMDRNHGVKAGLGSD